jgi:hypothetical protein
MMRTGFGIALPFAPATGLALAMAACGGGDIKRPYSPAPAPTELVSHVEEVRANAESFRSESTMDYWVKKDRVKGTVLLLGKPGSRLRFNAENPTGGNVAVDLACDGIGYKMIDYNNNCQLTGPCTRDTIAGFLNVELEPDDFYTLAIGSTPLIPNPTGKVTWDSNVGHEKLALKSGDGMWSQVIVLDGKEHRWDVLSSVVYDRRGNVEWKLENKGFREVKGADGKVFRVPRKTKFVQPKRKADLLVTWKQHDFNVELGPEKFDMQIPEGLAYCQ